MIKTWQKWFVCIFATIFVSVFFVYDAMFIQGNKASTTPPINAETSNEEELIAPEITPIIPETPKEEEEEQEDTLTLPNYTNGYACMTDAFNRLKQEKYYTYSYSSSGTSLGVVQKIKGVKYYSGSNFGSEVFAYCDSSFGKCFYERITSPDMQTYNYIKTTNINSNYKYSLSGALNTTLTNEQLISLVGPYRTQIISLRPVKGIDKQAKFDKTSDKNYYICSFVFSVNNLPAAYLKDIKRESGASSVTHSYLQINFYVSKTTGQIAKIEHSESYEIDIGIKLNITYYQTATLTIYKQPFEIKF